jgi:DNA-binding CsgD family transcriptional regulator
MSDKQPNNVRLGSAEGDLLLSIVYSLYRTIREEHRWPSILLQIQELLSAQTCSLSVHDFKTKTGSIAIHSGCFDEEYLRLYNEVYGGIDPWLKREEHFRNIGASWVGDELMPQAQLVTTEFYRKWLRPQGLMHQCAGVLFREQERLIHLTSYRSGRAQAFSRSTLYPLQRLLPHIRQTLELQQMFAGSQSDAAHPLGEMVRRLGSTTLIVDAERRLLAASEQAEGMLETGGPLVIENGRLDASSEAFTAKLRRLLEDSLRTAEGEGLCAGGAIELHDGAEISGTIKVAPLPPESLPGQTKPAVYVTINDNPMPAANPGKQRRRWLPVLLADDAETRAPTPNPVPGATESNEERLRRLYGLTRSEARFAELLAAGLGLPSAARRLGVGLNTVRTHLQRIYSKTDTHHQSELVALLLAGPAHLQVTYHRPYPDEGGSNGDDQFARTGETRQALAGSIRRSEKAPRDG